MDYFVPFFRRKHRLDPVHTLEEAKAAIDAAWAHSQVQEGNIAHTFPQEAQQGFNSTLQCHWLSTCYHGGSNGIWNGQHGHGVCTNNMEVHCLCQSCWC